MLVQSGVPEGFWAEALATATITINLCPSSAIGGKIPFELWHSRKLQERDERIIRTSGCLAYALIVGNPKLSPRAERCILSGYPADMKAYRLYSLERKKTIVRKDVKFYEDIFPCRMEVPRKSEVFNLRMPNADENPVRIRLPRWGETENPPARARTEPGAASQPSEPTESRSARKPGEQDEPESANQPEGRVEPGLAAREDPEFAYLPEGCAQDVGGDHSSDFPSQEDRVEPDASECRTKRTVRSRRDCICYNNQLSCGRSGPCDEPSNEEEALSGPHAEDWRRTMDEEILHMQKTEAWTLVKRPQGVKVVGGEWVFRAKRKIAGKITKFRARLVARGSCLTRGLDFTINVDSLVVRKHSLRILLALACEKGWELQQVDVVAAYLDGDLADTVYMQQPPGEVGFPTQGFCL